MSRTELLQLARSSAGTSDNGLILTARTGVIAAAAPAMSIFYATQPSYPSTILDTAPVVLERLRLQYTTITAFTTPVTAGRELALCKIEALPLPVGSRKSAVRKSALFGETGGGSGQVVADTGPLAPVGAAPSLDDVFGRVSLAGYGTAGATFTKEWRWDTGSSQMISVPFTDPVAVICTSAMDAGGTFELVIEVDYQCVPIGWPVP